MLNKRDYSNLETRARDWRALTESNPRSLAAGFPPPPFCGCPPSSVLPPPPSSLLPSSPSSSSSAALRQAEEKQRNTKGLAVRASPGCRASPCHTRLPVSLSWSESPGPEDRQETGFCPVLPQPTEYAFHLFYSLDSKLRNFPPSLSFAPPCCTQSKALGNWTGSSNKTKEAELSGSCVFIHSREIAAGKVSWPFAG